MAKFCLSEGVYNFRGAKKHRVLKPHSIVDSSFPIVLPNLAFKFMLNFLIMIKLCKQINSLIWVDFCSAMQADNILNSSIVFLNNKEQWTFFWIRWLTPSTKSFLNFLLLKKTIEQNNLLFFLGKSEYWRVSYREFLIKECV